MVITDTIEYSIHLPGVFIQTHWVQLLPTWTEPVLSILIVLQRPHLLLVNHTLETEAVKDQLRAQFLEMSIMLARALHQMGYATDFFDPRTGLPTLSPPGSATLDDVAVVHTALGYEVTLHGDCLSIIHPRWGAAVYPSILVSSAHPLILEHALMQIL